MSSSANTKTKKGKPLSLRRDKRTGKFLIRFEDLSKIRVTVPRILSEEGYRIVAIQDPGADSLRVGYTRQAPEGVSPIDELYKLREAERLISTLRDQRKKRDRTLRVMESLVLSSDEPQNVVLGEQFRPNVEAHIRVLDLLETNLLKIQKNITSDTISPLASYARSYLENAIHAISDKVNETIRNFNPPSVQKTWKVDAIPAWVVNKLIGNPITLKDTTSLVSFFFPSKENKGLKLTVAELRSEVLVQKLGPLIGMIKPIIQVINALEEDSLDATIKIPVLKPGVNHTGRTPVMQSGLRGVAALLITQLYDVISLNSGQPILNLKNLEAVFPDELPEGVETRRIMVRNMPHSDYITRFNEFIPGVIDHLWTNFPVLAGASSLDVLLEVDFLRSLNFVYQKFENFTKRNFRSVEITIPSDDQIDLLEQNNYLSAVGKKLRKYKSGTAACTGLGKFIAKMNKIPFLKKEEKEYIRSFATSFNSDKIQYLAIKSMTKGLRQAIELDFDRVMEQSDDSSDEDFDFGF